MVFGRISWNDFASAVVEVLADEMNRADLTECLEISPLKLTKIELEALLKLPPVNELDVRFAVA